MNDNIKITLTIAATAIICVGMQIYFSPFHTCTRETVDTAWCLNAIKAQINVGN